MSKTASLNLSGAKVNFLAGFFGPTRILPPDRLHISEVCFQGASRAFATKECVPLELAPARKSEKGRVLHSRLRRQAKALTFDGFCLSLSPHLSPCPTDARGMVGRVSIPNAALSAVSCLHSIAAFLGAH